MTATIATAKDLIQPVPPPRPRSSGWCSNSTFRGRGHGDVSARNPHETGPARMVAAVLFGKLALVCAIDSSGLV